MNGRWNQGDTQIAVSVIAALLVHALLVGGVGAAAHFGWGKEKPKPRAVEMEILQPPPKVEPPPPPRVEPEPEPEPEPPPPPKIAEKTQPRRIEKAPPPTPAPEPEPPAPGPPSDEAPPSEYTYKMPTAGPGGTMGVQQGAAPTGSGRGVKGATGTGTGGGGPPDSTGTGPAVASVASVKREPIAEGDFDYEKLKRDEYPADARRLGIEGPVQMRLLVDAQGRVVQTKLIKGLGHGLDQKAAQLARKLKFKPAIDTNDQPVAMWITWTFKFIVPE